VVRGRQSKSRYGIAGCGGTRWKHLGEQFGKPSSLFIASCPKCCVDRLSSPSERVQAWAWSVHLLSSESYCRRC